MRDMLSPYLLHIQIVQDGLDIGAGICDVLAQHRLVQRLRPVVLGGTQLAHRLVAHQLAGPLRIVPIVPASPALALAVLLFHAAAAAALLLPLGDTGQQQGRVLGVGAHVAAHHEGCEALVDDGVHHILQHAQDVEALQNGVRQLHVLGETEGGVVAAADRIGCGDNCTAGLCCRRRFKQSKANQRALNLTIRSIASN
jgi:hypothetical protein